MRTALFSAIVTTTVATGASAQEVRASAAAPPASTTYQEQTTVGISTGCVSSTACALPLPAVPRGKRLVVQYVNVSWPSKAAPSDPVVQLYRNTSGAGEIRLLPQTVNGVRNYAGGLVTFNVNGGERPMVVVSRGNLAAGGLFFASVIGTLVPQP